MKWTKQEYSILEGQDAVDAAAVHALLKTSYWAKDRPLAVIEKSIENSLCFSLFRGDSQIGFGRALTDFATYAVLLDVIVREDHRGKGLGKWLIECMTTHPSIRGVRQVLWTTDAERLYEKFGFTRLPNKVAVLTRAP